jgi:hypothetical protein
MDLKVDSFIDEHSLFVDLEEKTEVEAFSSFWFHHYKPDFHLFYWE